MTRKKSSGKARKKPQKRAAAKKPDDAEEPELITTYTEADIRHVHELIEKHGWDHLREKK